MHTLKVLLFIFYIDVEKPFVNSVDGNILKKVFFFLSSLQAFKVRRLCFSACSHFECVGHQLGSVLLTSGPHTNTGSGEGRVCTSHNLNTEQNWKKKKNTNEK